MIRTATGSAAYRGLARYYEALNTDCDYEKWSQYLVSLLKEHSAGPVGADIGCGNGRMTCLLARAGYAMTAFDPSPDMLAEAVAYAPTVGCRIPFVLGDMARFKLPKRADFAVSVNDCVNYIPPERLAKSFSNVASQLKKGGVFLFDVSTPSKLAAMDGQLYFDDGEELSCFWQNALEGDRLRMELTFFVREGERYRRFDEEHLQYLYENERLERALEEAGFVRISSWGAFTREPPAAGYDRVQFCAVKG